MANVNAPYGLFPIQSAVGAASNYEMVQAQVAYNAGAIYRGDPVKQLATGFVSQWSAGTAVSQMIGIFWGCEYLSVSQGKKVFNNYWPGADVASTNNVLAYLVPCQGSASPLFRIQTDSTGAAFADIGANFDIVVGTGSTTTGQSGAYLDISTHATTATLPFRLVQLYGGAQSAGGFGGIQPSSTNPYGGSSTGAYNWAIVRANVVGAGATGIDT